jgi:hypothetical protein
MGSDNKAELSKASLPLQVCVAHAHAHTRTHAHAHAHANAHAHTHTLSLPAYLCGGTVFLHARSTTDTGRLQILIFFNGIWAFLFWAVSCVSTCGVFVLVCGSPLCLLYLAQRACNRLHARAFRALACTTLKLGIKQRTDNIRDLDLEGGRISVSR